jgi:hypothetical protein
MTTTTTGSQSTAIGGEEILSTAQLRSEAATAELVLEEFSALCLRIGEWTQELPERYVAAPFGTDALTLAINHVTEADGDGGAISEALAEIVAGLDEADGLGEKVAEIEADGQVDSFKAS